MRGLKGKTAIVTGGAAGIGAAIVERFQAEGAKVVNFDLKGAPPVDITDYEAVKEAVAAAGPVDILVNNAGWDMFKPFLKTDPAFWQKIISINLVGPMNLMHCVLPGMVERGGGKVVNIASDAGRVGSSGEGPYSACKGGIIAVTKTLARELAIQGRAPEHGVPGTDGDEHAGIVHAGRGQPGQAARGLSARGADRAPGQARGHRRRGTFPRQRRCGIHHRPDDQRLGRADDARLG
jgi:2-hydroxycyclohexanecarboxyl-CoA dehydrogenase